MEHCKLSQLSVVLNKLVYLCSRLCMSSMTKYAYGTLLIRVIELLVLFYLELWQIFQQGLSLEPTSIYTKGFVLVSPPDSNNFPLRMLPPSTFLIVVHKSFFVIFIHANKRRSVLHCTSNSDISTVCIVICAVLTCNGMGECLVVLVLCCYQSYLCKGSFLSLLPSSWG